MVYKRNNEFSSGKWVCLHFHPASHNYNDSLDFIPNMEVLCPERFPEGITSSGISANATGLALLVAFGGPCGSEGSPPKKGNNIDQTHNSWYSGTAVASFLFSVGRFLSHCPQ